MSRTIIHVDMNAYFATCAQIINPRYRGKPVAVGGKAGRSIISTASYEARKYGVKSGMPTYMAKKLCPDIIITKPDFQLYERYTNKFVSIVHRYASKVQLASIDECYADITEELKKADVRPLKYIKNIQDEIYNETGLSCSIGVGPTKFLAKMGSDYKKPMGITVIRRRDIKKILWPIPIEDMYGCGKKTAKLLKEEFNIATIGDFAQANDYRLKERLGKLYGVLNDWANGKGSDNVSEEIEDPKSIGNSRTLYYDTNNYEELAKKLKELSRMVAERAQKQDLYGNSVAITLKYYNFKNITRETTLIDPFNDEQTIYLYAMKLFDRNYKENDNLRLLGVTLRNVAPLSSFIKQLSIFDEEKEIRKKNGPTQAIIDRINRELGRKALKKASQIGDKND